MSYVTASSKKIHLEIYSLKKEIAQLRSLIISVLGKDPEGNYRPAFVRRILKAAEEKPARIFVDARDFLSQLSSR